MNYARGKHVAWRDVGPETIVIHLRTKRVYGLNATGGEVWKALDADSNPVRLASLVGEPLSAGDVEVFLGELAAEDLLGSRAEASTPAPPAPARFGRDPAPPRILWRDQVTAFVGECLLNEAGGEGCEGFIANS